jgi:hypothetical protein
MKIGEFLILGAERPESATINGGVDFRAASMPHVHEIILLLPGGARGLEL